MIGVVPAALRSSGGWYPSAAPGLASDTVAQFAWNDAGDKFYIGIVSSEGLSTYGGGPIIEVGGLYGLGAGEDPNVNVTPSGSDKATQLQFSYWDSGTANIWNQFGEEDSGVGRGLYVQCSEHHH